MKLALAFLAVFVAGVVSANETPKGSGKNVTGGYGKPEYDWTFGKNSLDELKNKLKAGNVYIRLHGEGTITISGEYWYVGSHVTLDGLGAKITINGPKGLYIQKQENVVIMGVCFKNNETAINMSAGGEKIWVHKNTFVKSAWGSPVAFSGYDCDMNTHKCKKEAKEITISENWFGPDHYGPLMFYGVGEATFYRNVWKEVITRIPRAQNQGTFHICNNLFESWHLGIQGDDGAKFMYENNVFNRVDRETSYPGKLGNNMNMNTDEKIEVCMKNNVMLGNQKDNHVKEGKGTKLVCNFNIAYEHSCPAVGDANKFIQDLEKTAGVTGGWCKL